MSKQTISKKSNIPMLNGRKHMQDKDSQGNVSFQLWDNKVVNNKYETFVG